MYKTPDLCSILSVLLIFMEHWLNQLRQLWDWQWILVGRSLDMHSSLYVKHITMLLGIHFSLSIIKLLDDITRIPSSSMILINLLTS